MIDQLRQMAIFAKVINHGTFRGAAKELRLSPSVVSHHISMLEEHLGFTLMYRSTRSIALTPEGERLLAATRKMLDAVETELTDLSMSVGEASGEIRVTAPAVLSQSRLPKSLAYFSSIHPRINLKLDFSDNRRSLIEDGFDLAIRMSKISKKSSNTRQLFNVSRRLIASKSYLAKHPKITDPRQIEQLDWLSLDPVQNTPTTFYCDSKEETIKPKVRIISNDAQSLYELVAGGAGLAIVPDFLAKTGLATGRIKYVLPEWSVYSLDVFAEWPANTPKSGLTHLLLDHLSSARFD